MNEKELKRKYEKEESRHDKASKKENARHEKMHDKEQREAEEVGYKKGLRKKKPARRSGRGS